MQAAAKSAGANLLQANSDSKPDKEASLIDTFTARGVEGWDWARVRVNRPVPQGSTPH